jgi:hypothetical protein
MNIANNEKLLMLIREYTNDNHCMELLQFFGKYPCARFTRLAIVHGLFNGDAHGNSRLIEKALKRIVDGNLVCTRLENGIILYSLTEDKYSRDTICEFAVLDLPQRQLLFKANRDTNDKQVAGKPETRCKSITLSSGPLYRTAGMAAK